MEKLKVIHVIGGAIGITLLIVAATHFGLIKNINLETTKTIGEINTAMGGIRQGASDADEVDPVFTEAKSKAEKEREEAKVDFKLTFAQFEEFKKRYRRITFRRTTGEFEDVFPQLLAEYRDRLVPDFVAFVELHGCTLVTVPDLGMPPMPPIAFPTGALFPIPDPMGGAAAGGGMAGGLGGSAMGGFGGGGGGGGGPLTITVQGTYSAVAALLKRLPTFTRLCLIGPVTFRNVDPITETVEASFALTFYLVADGPEEVVKAALAKAAGGGAAGGMPGGMPGGAMPGGDPSMAGGSPAAPAGPAAPSNS